MGDLLLEYLDQQIEEISISGSDIDQFQTQSFESYIRDAGSYREKTIRRVKGERKRGDKLPWVKTENDFLFYPGESTIWMGRTGERKSMVTGQVAIDLIMQGKKVCIASFEMLPETTLERMVYQALCRQDPTESAIDAFFNFIKGRLFIYDQQDSVSPERALNMTECCFGKFDIDHVFIDSLMKITLPRKDTDQMVYFLNRLMGITKNYRKHTHLIAHARKNTESNNLIPNLYDVRGAAEIVENFHNIIAVVLDKKYKAAKQKPKELRSPKEQEMLDDPKRTEQFIAILKHRTGGFEDNYGFGFDNKSLQFVEGYGQPKRYHEVFNSEQI